MIDSFILDFYCSKLLLGIEIDGDIHKEQEVYDTQRDEKLRHL
jgi:very-short-patch-repair endonuclease